MKNTGYGVINGGSRMRINLYRVDICAAAALLFAGFLVPSQGWHIALTLAALVLWLLLVEGSLLQWLQLWLNRKARRNGRSRMM